MDLPGCIPDLRAGQVGGITQVVQFVNGGQCFSRKPLFPAGHIHFLQVTGERSTSLCGGPERTPGGLPAPLKEHRKVVLT